MNKLQYKTPEALRDQLLAAHTHLAATRAASGVGTSTSNGSSSTSSSSSSSNSTSSSSKPAWRRCVDLGCGTGLMGPLLLPYMARGAAGLEGVDLSAGMVKEAARRGCYGRLEVGVMRGGAKCQRGGRGGGVGGAGLTRGPRAGARGLIGGRNRTDELVPGEELVDRGPSATFVSALCGGPSPAPAPATWPFIYTPACDVALHLHPCLRRGPSTIPLPATWPFTCTRACNVALHLHPCLRRGPSPHPCLPRGPSTIPLPATWRFTFTRACNVALELHPCLRHGPSPAPVPATWPFKYTVPAMWPFTCTRACVVALHLPRCLQLATWPFICTRACGVALHLQVGELVGYLEAEAAALTTDTMTTTAKVENSEPVSASATSSMVSADTVAGQHVDRSVPYDLLVAADVFVYIGDLAPVLRAAAAAAVAGAVLAFSTEALELEPGGKTNCSSLAAGAAAGKAAEAGRKESNKEAEAGSKEAEEVKEAEKQGGGQAQAQGQGLRLQVTGRYAHTEEYLRRVGGEAGWRLVSISQSIIRYNGGEPIWGHLCVMERV